VLLIANGTSILLVPVCLAVDIAAMYYYNDRLARANNFKFSTLF